jgi:predicted PurR-regulated permease PerM
MSMHQKSSTTRNALVVLAVIATGAALLWAQAILTPLALALFLLIMVDGFARAIRNHARRLPEWAALPLALAIMAVAAGLTLWVVAENGAGFATQLVSDAPRVNVVLREVAGFFGLGVPPTVASLAEQLNPTRYLGQVVGAMRSFGASALYVMIYLGFLLASRAGFQQKARALFPDAGEFDEANGVFRRIRDGVERYLWITTLAALMIAACSYVAMAALGLQNAVFWAFLIFVASYVPVLGGFVGALLPPLFALLQFEAYWRAIALFVALQVIFFIVGSVIQPKMQRDRLNIDPVVVLLALTLWGAIWGVAGMFLSTPLTVMLIVILAQFESTRWMAVLLSGDGRPEAGAGLKPEGEAASQPRPPRLAAPGPARPATEAAG